MDEVKTWTTEQRLESLESAVENIIAILGHYEKMHENATVIGKVHNRILQLIVNEIGIGDEVVINDGANDASVATDGATNGKSEDDSA